jgi:hypothetical protein
VGEGLIYLASGNIRRHLDWPYKVALGGRGTTVFVNRYQTAHGEVYSIQHYVIKFVIHLRQVCGFYPGSLISSTSKTDCNDITEILLKVALKHHKPQGKKLNISI